MSDIPNQPISDVLWVSVDDVEPNDYNPNTVAGQEMKLLHTSIKHDGYTQPIVTIYDKEKKKYVIVDKDIFDTTQGRVPIVVIKKDINERMAATVRHNRARGQHSVTGMSNMVFSMLDNGWKDEEVCNHLGMEPDELIRLKHITGFSKLFADTEYNKAWVSKSQIKLKQQQKDLDKSRLTDNG